MPALAEIEPCYFPGCNGDTHIEVNTEAQERGAAPMYWVECHRCAASGPCRTTSAEAVDIHNEVALDLQDYNNELRSIGVRS